MPMAALPRRRGRTAPPPAAGAKPAATRAGLAALPREVLADIMRRAAGDYPPRALRLAEVSTGMRAAVAADPELWAAALTARMAAARPGQAREILAGARRDPRWPASAPHVRALRLPGQDGADPQPRLAPASLLGRHAAGTRYARLDHLILGGGPCAPRLRGLGQLTTLTRLDIDLGGCGRGNPAVRAAALAPLACLSDLRLRQGVAEPGVAALLAGLPALEVLVLDRVALQGGLRPLAAGATALRRLGLAWQAPAHAGAVPGDCRAVAGMAQLVTLALIGCPGLACPEVTAIASLTGLRGLDLVCVDRLPALTMPNLSHLCLAGSTVREGELAGAVEMPHLAHLDLRMSWEYGPGLADAPDGGDGGWLRRRDHLAALWLNYVGTGGALLGAAGAMAGLTELALLDLDASCLDATALSGLPHLRRLHLGAYFEGERATLMAALAAAAPGLAALELLRLRCRLSVNAPTCAELIRLPRLSALTLVDADSPICHELSSHLCALTSLTGLTSLRLTSQRILALPLARALGRLTGLRQLRIWPGPGVSGPAVAHLRHLGRLEALEIHLAADALTRLGGLRTLRALTRATVVVSHGGAPLPADAAAAALQRHLVLPIDLRVQVDPEADCDWPLRPAGTLGDEVDRANSRMRW